MLRFPPIKLNISISNTDTLEYRDYVEVVSTATAVFSKKMMTKYQVKTNTEKPNFPIYIEGFFFL